MSNRTLARRAQFGMLGLSAMLLAGCSTAKPPPAPRAEIEFPEPTPTVAAPPPPMTPAERHCKPYSGDKLVYQRCLQLGPNATPDAILTRVTVEAALAVTGERRV